MVDIKERKARLAKRREAVTNIKTGVKMLSTTATVIISALACKELGDSQFNVISNPSLVNLVICALPTLAVTYTIYRFVKEN